MSVHGAGPSACQVTATQMCQRDAATTHGGDNSARGEIWLWAMLGDSLREGRKPPSAAPLGDPHNRQQVRKNRCRPMSEGNRPVRKGSLAFRRCRAIPSIQDEGRECGPRSGSRPKTQTPKHNIPPDIATSLRLVDISRVAPFGDFGRIPKGGAKHEGLASRLETSYAC